MIKYYCDRCGEEIQVKHGEHENVAVQFDGCARMMVHGTIVGRLFCEKCKMEFAEWLGMGGET